MIIFGLLRRGMTDRNDRLDADAFRSGTNGHQITFPTMAAADIIGFK
jgi:hypothetical protein